MKFWPVIVFALVSSCAFAETYFVQSASGAGVSADDLISTTELVKNAISENGRNQTTSDPKAARYILQPRLLKLGNSYIMTLDKISSGKIIFSGQLKAARIEEFDTVSSRLTRAVIDEVPVKGDARVNEITENESVGNNRRREAQKHWYFGFGPYGANNLGTNGALYDLSIAYAWDIQMSQLKIFWEGTYPSSGGSTVVSNSGATVSVSGVSDLGLGLNYYFKDTDVAPFITADFGYGSANSVSGFIGGFGAGYGIFRTASVNLELSLRYAIVLNSTPLGTASIYGARLGLYF